MTELEMNYDREQAKMLASQLEDAQIELRAFCEAEGLLPIYEERYEHYFGENAYPNYSLKDWLGEAEFYFNVLRGTLASYLISNVMAHIVSGRSKLTRGKFKSVSKRLAEIKPLMQELKHSLQEIYLDFIVKEPNAPRSGGLMKDLNRNCRLILDCLETNGKHDGVDFKSFDEAFNYAAEIVISDEGIGDKKRIEAIRRFYPNVFRQWLRINPIEAERFRMYTGMTWNE